MTWWTARGAGVAGLVATLLLFGGQGLIQAGGTSEPRFTAPAGEIQRYFETRDAALFAAGSYLEVLGLLAFLWFVCGVHTALRSRAGDHSWLSTVALASGVAMVGGMLSGGWELAVLRLDEGLDPQLGRLAFDQGNLGFANAWVMLGSFAVATGWALRSDSSTPGWLAWWAIGAGVGLVAVRASWTSSLWFLPYAVFWLWVVTVSVRALAGGGFPAVRDGRRRD